MCGAESEKRLIKKCRELNSEIVANAAKVQTALKLSEEDQSTIAALKKEIEKAWKLVDASHEKEARAKETIQQLKLEITNLSRLVEQGAGLSLGQEQTVRALRSLGAWLHACRQKRCLYDETKLYVHLHVLRLLRARVRSTPYRFCPLSVPCC